MRADTQLGTAAGGVAVGLIFRGALSELNRLAEPRHRAAVVSTFFAAAYLGLGVPVLLTGLISQMISTIDASAAEITKAIERAGTSNRQIAIAHP